MELEAKLHPTAECMHGGLGELEIEEWTDGQIVYEASIKYSALPDGTQLDVESNGTRISVMTLRQGWAKVKETLRTDSNLNFKVGDKIEICLNGRPYYEGTLKPD